MSVVGVSYSPLNMRLLFLHLNILLLAYHLFQMRAWVPNLRDHNLFLLPQFAKFLSCMPPTFDIYIQSYFQLGIKFIFYFRDISREKEQDYYDIFELCCMFSVSLFKIAPSVELKSGGFLLQIRL